MPPLSIRAVAFPLLVCLYCALIAPLTVLALAVDSSRILSPRAKADNGNGNGAGANADKETSTMDDLEKQIKKLTKDRDTAIAVGAGVVGLLIIVGGLVFWMKGRSKKNNEAARRAEYDTEGYRG